MKKKLNIKKLIIVVSFLIFSLIGILLYDNYKKNKAMISLVGGKSLVVGVKSDYRDPGVVVRYNNKEVDKKNYELVIDGEVNSDKLGEYTITYKTKYKGVILADVRVVKVVDDEKPEIITNVDSVVKDFCSNKITTNFEYKAVDNYDGDITEKLEKQEEKNSIKFIARDSSGNIATKEIKVTYTEEPKSSIVLNGSKLVYIPVGTKYVDAGAKLKNGCGEDVNISLGDKGNVNTDEPAEFVLTYSMKEANVDDVQRKVVVYTPFSLNNGVADTEKTIYLTFDDGPGQYTRSVLNTLRKYDVKATFFVTGQFSSYLSLIKDEFDDGHSIGVHTYTHKWNVYTSVNDYLDDFKKMNDVIESYIGGKSVIFRFPGGASNTVSMNYASGVVKAIAAKLNSYGYQYFDWNVDSNDAANANRKQIYNNVINGVKHCTSCIILMHDIKKTTADELDNILNTLTKSGYKFGVLKSNSPVIHHKIAN